MQVWHETGWGKIAIAVISGIIVFVASVVIIYPLIATTENDEPPDEQLELASLQSELISEVSGSPTYALINWPFENRISLSCSRYTSVLHRVNFYGRVAFCYEMNGKAPDGYYRPLRQGSNERVGQYLANFLDSEQTQYLYIATQVLIWSAIYDSSVTSWGGSGVSQEHINIIARGTAPPVPYVVFSGGAQNIIIWGEL